MKTDSIVSSLRKNSLVDLLFTVKGNPKACILTEPLWGIPNTLYAPFITIYMYNLGVNDVQIGLLISISLFLQLISSLLSGAITDKFGRRKVTFFVDLFAWSIPCLIWMFAKNFWWFLAAAIINSGLQITSNSWTCLLVEDADKKQIVGIFNWIYISGLLAAFFAPISGLMVTRFSVVSTMRVLYFFAFVLMTFKFVILYIYSTETKQGIIRMQETKGVSIFKMLAGNKDIFIDILKSREMLMCLMFMIIFNITSTVSSNFYSLLITKTLNISESYLAYFPIIRAVVVMFLLFGAQHRLEKMPIKIPMLAGVCIYIACQIFLVASAYVGFYMIIIYVVLEALAYAVVMPRKDFLVTVFVTPQERSRIMGIMNVMMLGISAPFGYLAGVLSNINRTLPFILNICLYLIVAVVLHQSKKLS